MTKGLKKMFGKGGGSNSKKIFPGPVNVTTTIAQNDELYRRKKPVYTEGQKRRAHQVGRVLYDNIVQLVNSGELSPQLAAMSVEIVRVKVVPNFSSVNIYWFSSGSQDDDEMMEKLLREHEGLLRQLLTSRHVLGTIPRMNFVRDDSRARYLRVESLLSKADFGPDFVPTMLDTSIRDCITLDIGVKDHSPAKKLQAQFDKVSSVNNAEIAENWLSEQRDWHKRNSGDTREKKIVAEKRGDVKAQSSGTPASEHGQSHEIPGLSCQPAFSDVEQLHKQFLSNNTQVSPNSSKLWNPHTSHLSSVNVNLNGLNTYRELVDKDFRDDLYGVPYSELFNKILMKRQKVKSRPKEYTNKPIPSLTVKSNGLKAILQKKPKSKGKLSSQCDYRSVGLAGYGDSENDEFLLENEETSDEEF